MNVRTKRALKVVSVVLICAAGLFFMTSTTRIEAAPIQNPVFSGDALNLKRTVVVPALGSRLDPRRNVIWTAAFESAWRKMEANVIGGPIALDRASTTATELAKSPPIAKNTLPNGCKVAAYRVTPQTAATIQKEFRDDFLDTPTPVALPSDALVAFAKLDARVPFKIPYFDFNEALSFGDGTTTQSVCSFGIRPKDEYAYDDLREQPWVLYVKNRNFGPKHLVEEFAVDLCAQSEPCQIVVACVPPGATLDATLAETEKKIQNYNRGKGEAFGPNDVLQVPEIVFEIVQHFKDVEGAALTDAAGRKYPVALAVEGVQFQLNKGGAIVRSSARLLAVPIPSLYILNRPFLVYVKNRGASRPFFAMWVANAELIRPWGK